MFFLSVQECEGNVSTVMIKFAPRRVWVNTSLSSVVAMELYVSSKCHPLPSLIAWQRTKGHCFIPLMLSVAPVA